MLLENDKKFDRCSEFGTGFDPDDTEIARAVYYLLFNNKVHDTDSDFTFSDIGTHKKYREDTLNTFNTLFGENTERAVKYSNNDTAFIKKLISNSTGYRKSNRFYRYRRMRTQGGIHTSFRNVSSSLKYAT